MPIEVRILLAWGGAFALVNWLTPHAMRLARSTGMVDIPRLYHEHPAPTPLLGGLALFAGVMTAGLLLAPSGTLALPLALALLVGLYHDYRKCRGAELRAPAKLALQVLPAAVLMLSGHSIDHVSLPGPGLLVLPWWVDYPLTLLWLVGMTNAVNFLDGMDGLVAGLCAVATFTLMIIAMVKGVPFMAIWAAAAMGACVAFLRYNFHPARVFMGDAGTHFLGFLLGAMAVLGYFKAATLAGLSAPLLALFIPVFNVVFVVVRRLRKGKSLLQALTEGDLEQSFNVLGRRTGFNPMETVLVFLLAAMLLSASALGILFAIK